MELFQNQSKSYKSWVTIAQSVAEAGFCSTMVFCGILIFLTIFGVKRNFGSYKYLLILFPAVGIFFATVELILYPNVHSFNAGYFFYSTRRPFGVGIEIVTILMAFYTSIYASTICMLSVQFVYRYWAIFDETKLRFFKGWKFLFCVAYSVIVGAQWGLSMYFFNQMDDYTDHYMREELLYRYDLTITEIARLCLVSYNEDGSLRWRNNSSTIDMTIFMIVQYTIVIYCAIVMYQKMEEKLKMLSVSLRNLHKQFYKTLLLQIFTPTLCLFAPVVFIIYLPLFDLKISIPTGMFLCAFTLYPALDAMIVMYIVTDYRNAAKKMLKKIFDWMYSILSLNELPENGTTTAQTRETALGSRVWS
ncbi:Protein CBR-STR-23 [Caenorhabditis briggsae]|uniref:Protein CBR-STR-23 n=1 Tax=Caenorhabditis briggsae TaxID=6238 RepID=A8XDH8_CAEBR|nr:Protein CBR-STR-23 [Caenorhabditis briggsae]CAP30697.1 Protein CBR-STR-23 [Caenorhabditis briggsae]